MDAASFKTLPLRCKPPENRNSQPVSRADLEICGAQNVATGLLTDELSESILGGEVGEHLGGAVRPLVNENRNSPVKRLWTQPLRHEHDGFVTESEQP